MNVQEEDGSAGADAPMLEDPRADSSDDDFYTIGIGASAGGRFQGSYFSRPVPEEKLLERVAAPVEGTSEASSSISTSVA